MLTFLGVLSRICLCLACLSVPCTVPAATTTVPGHTAIMTSDRFLIDQSGRRIHMGGPKKRIISLYTAHTENLFALGLNQAVIGVSAHDNFPSDAANLPVFSAHDDPERLLAAKPDLVLVRPMLDRGYPDFIRRLEMSGIMVVSLQPRTIQEMFTYWKILGALTGRQQRAERMISAFNKAVDSFKKITIDQTEKPRVYFESIHSKMKTFAPRSMAIFVLEAAGGINVAADAPVRPNNNISIYGKERILSHAGQIDVYIAQQGAMNQIHLEDILKEPGFEIIKAVSRNRVYLVSEQIVSRPTCRLLNGINHIGTLLYPRVFRRYGPSILERFIDRTHLDPEWIKP